MEQDGLFCPFILDLAGEDRVTIWRIIEKYFFKALGNTHSMCSDTFTKFKSALGAISTCKAVKELTHIYKLIDISILSQTRLYLLVSGESYLGCVLFGAEYKLTNMPSEVLEPCTASQLKELLMNQATHQGSLRKLAGMLRKTEEELLSMRIISKFARECALTEEQKHTVIELCKCLNFNSIPWKFNDTTVLEMFEYLNDPNMQVPDETYLNPNYLFFTDRYEEVLSVFGFQAPTFDLGSCGRVNLNDRNYPRVLRYRLVAISTAIGSYRRIKSEKSIYNNPSSSLSSIYSERNTEKPKIQEMWTALRSFSNAANPTSSSSSSGSSRVASDLFSI